MAQYKMCNVVDNSVSYVAKNTGLYMRRSMMFERVFEMPEYIMLDMVLSLELEIPLDVDVLVSLEVTVVTSKMTIWKRSTDGWDNIRGAS
jgi:hypothetical protein